ncbi:hypothetical protein SUGI_0986680 [Cryptomeria japonica]|uniref:uncharacterized protein LOC131038205 n=1 Tax=Cryptomeria japonica TaxID=3369 RepID=UPI0024148690|nr:uncharacterized protein LOC131038205 [Cryptomeria japonica]XP_057826540.2 uncharacterized protein LOC131038205 [Cryptomeria japonica]XP_057826541.2 uncharacterized protein LOC131038205 [Cryptomeria japonica]GLJ46783.1 hypothetical protein SUGI_0986680 [Cryptomeria japonica]
METSKRSRQQFEVSPGSDSDEDEAPRQKKPRFPKGKKQKSVDEFNNIENASVGGPVKGTDPRLAAKQRARRRRDMAEELLNAQAHDTSVLDDIGAAEEDYEDDEALEDDGIKIEPFNLKQEREEGYFDSEGNYVEYGNGNEIKDAWLDSVEVDTRFADEHLEIQERDNDQELSSLEVGKIKRRIANTLQPGETVLHALRRMKAISNDKSKRGKMPEETKVVFDQLTDDAMKLMDNGDYNVYDDKKETFEREAEGYERIARAKGGPLVGIVDTSISVNAGKMEDIFADDEGEARQSYSSVTASGPWSENSSDAIDIFGEGDGAAAVDIFSDSEVSISHSTVQETTPQSGHIDESTLSTRNFGEGGVPSDYVFDGSSGYYYSSRLGYYYDPSTGFFCSATTGKWYKFNEETNIYEEMPTDSS